METRSHTLSMNFKNEIRRFLLISDENGNFDARLSGLKKELEELAEFTEESDPFWKGAEKIFLKYSFFVARE